MFPWLFFWAPQVQLPFSGDVAQRIEPQTQWFFDAIPAGAGDGEVERKAFEVASYGRQLGLITELLLDLAEQTPPRTKAGRAARQRLQDIRSRIEAIKVSDTAALVAEVEAALERLRRLNPADHEALRQRLAARR